MLNISAYVRIIIIIVFNIISVVCKKNIAKFCRKLSVKECHDLDMFRIVYTFIGFMLFHVIVIRIGKTKAPTAT